MKVLAIDTCTDACSIALMVDGDLLSDHRIASQKHAALVLPMIDSLFASAQIQPAQLDALVYGQGPGSFTGVRIGVGVAQGIALGADIGVVGISTLQSIAQGCYREYADNNIHACIDARMQEVYYCHYNLDDDLLMQPLHAEQIAPPHALNLLNPLGQRKDVSADRVWAGSGADHYAKLLETQCTQVQPGALLVRPQRLPDARDLITLSLSQIHAGMMKPAEQAIPVYLRNNVAKTAEQRAREHAEKSNS